MKFLCALIMHFSYYIAEVFWYIAEVFFDSRDWHGEVQIVYQPTHPPPSYQK